MNTPELKQRISDYVEHEIGDEYLLLTDCLAHIEEQENKTSQLHFECSECTKRIDELQSKLTAEETKLERAKRVVENGPKTLDAKWLDPECWNGCQSLVYKNKLTAAEQRNEQLEREAGQLREALRYFRDKLVRHPGLFAYELELLAKALSPTAGTDYVKREELRVILNDLSNGWREDDPVMAGHLIKGAIVSLESLLNQKGTDQ